jgi:MFS family permease
MLGGALMGIAMGTQYGALPFFIARYFGMRHFGVILGVMYSGVMAAQGITPVLLDAAFDALGSYRAAIIVAGTCLSVGALLLLMLPRYNRAAESGDDPMLGIAHG